MTITEAPATPELYSCTEVYNTAASTWEDCGDYGPGAIVPESPGVASAELTFAWENYIEEWASADGDEYYRLAWYTLDDELVAMAELTVIRDEDGEVIGWELGRVDLDVDT